MRTYGRIVPNPLYPDVKQWVEVDTEPNGANDYVWLTTLIQVLKLNLGESPFYANYGIPAKQSVLQQIAPDFYVANTQKQFSQFFASLIITKTALNPPTYRVNVTTNQGVQVEATIAT